MNFSELLTDEQKRQLLTQRIQQFAAEAYQHSLNLKVAQINNDATAEQTATDAISNLENALQVHIEALAALPEVSTTETPAP